MESKLYAVICEALNILIEDFDSGDLDLPAFATTVERMMGKTTLSEITPDHGFEWKVLDTGMGYDLCYVSTAHRAVMQIRLVDGNRYVHATIKHEDSEPEPESVAIDSEGCGDPTCSNCNSANSIVRGLIPMGLLLSFGPLIRDEN